MVVDGGYTYNMMDSSGWGQNDVSLTTGTQQQQQQQQQQPP